MRNGTPSSDRSASERAPLIGTRPPADFIRARSCNVAASQTPYTWPRPTICRIKQSSCQGAIHTWSEDNGERGLKTDQVKRLKELESEASNAIRPREMPNNERLRKAVSDLTLEKLILREAASGNF